MKKSIIVVIILSGAVLFLLLIKPNPAQKKEYPVSPGPDSKGMSENTTNKDIQLKKAKVILESQDWIISLSPLMAKGSREEDVLTFSEGRVISRNLFVKGYPQVRYALNFSQEGSVSWEAVAESESGGLASWRGELRGESFMRGILSLQAKDGSLEDLFFEAGIVSDAKQEPQEGNSAQGNKTRNKRRPR